MWQPVAVKLVIPERLTAKIFGNFCCLFFGRTAAVGDRCAPKSTGLRRPEVKKLSFCLLLLLSDGAAFKYCQHCAVPCRCCGTGDGWLCALLPKCCAEMWPHCWELPEMPIGAIGCSGGKRDGVRLQMHLIPHRCSRIFQCIGKWDGRYSPSSSNCTEGLSPSFFLLFFSYLSTSEVNDLLHN